MPTPSTSCSPTSVIPHQMRMTADDQEASDMTTTFDRQNPRSCILQVGVSAGQLCGVANTHLTATDNNDTTNAKAKANATTTTTTSSSTTTALVASMCDLLWALFETSESLQLNWITSIEKKLALNNRKYPVELCKGKSGKYTQYSQVTGVTQTNQSTKDPENTATSTTTTTTTIIITRTDWAAAVSALAGTIQVFAEAREWSQFHTPRNIILALLGEVGELAEIVQWKGDDVETLRSPQGLNADVVDKLSQEVADVSIYLLRLASVCQVVDPLADAMRQRVGIVGGKDDGL